MSGLSPCTNAAPLICAGSGGAAARVTDFGARGDGRANDTEAFKAAIAAAEHIFIPPGTYLVDFGEPTRFPGAIQTIPGGRSFEGAGHDSILRPFTRTARGCLGTHSDNKSVWSKGLRFSNLSFKGWLQEDGHYEYGALLYLSGVRNVLVEKCLFEASRGDAITIASGFGGGAGYERHNFNIVIRDCVFDGVLSGRIGGRNAISVIDVENIIIERNIFRNWSRLDMPGSIVFEPDEAFSVIRHVRIEHNRFSACKGNRGHIALSVDNIGDDHFSDVSIAHNHFSQNVALCIYTNNRIPERFPTIQQDIRFMHNFVLDCEFVVSKVVGPIWGLTISHNIAQSSMRNHARIAIGDGSANWTVKDVRIFGNAIYSSSPIPVAITDNIENLFVYGNRIRGAERAALRIGQNQPQTKRRNVFVMRNTFDLQTSLQAVQYEGLMSP